MFSISFVVLLPYHFVKPSRFSHHLPNLFLSSISPLFMVIVISSFIARLQDMKWTKIFGDQQRVSDTRTTDYCQVSCFGEHENVTWPHKRLQVSDSLVCFPVFIKAWFVRVLSPPPPFLTVLMRTLLSWWETTENRREDMLLWVFKEV